MLFVPLSNEAVSAAYHDLIPNSHNYVNKINSDKLVDFKEDKKKAEEWGKEKEKDWKLTATEKGKVDDFLNDKNKIRTNYKEITFSMAGSFEEEIKDLKKT